MFAAESAVEEAESRAFSVDVNEDGDCDECSGGCFKFKLMRGLHP